MQTEKPILYKSSQDPLYGRTLNRVIDDLRTKLTGRVEAAWLFGSAAAGKLHKFSDVDLILVQDTSSPFLERPQAFFDLIDTLPSLEMLVYTPDEFNRLTLNPSPGFWRSVTDTMVKIL